MMLEPDFLEKDSYTFEDVVTLMAFLRSENGCPWDKKQDHQTLRKNLIEEAYEGVDAIMSNDPKRIADEMGDILMQVVFHAQIGSENETFNIDDVTTGLCKKLIRRHTHLFGSDKVEDAEEALLTWEGNKKIEKGHESQADVLRDVPHALPALTRAYKVQKKAADVGFDWPDPSGAKEKVKEELGEIEQATPESKEEEIGDFLFAAVNFVRLMGFEPEVALSASIEKFIRRFSDMEALALSNGSELESMGLEAMDKLWDQVKRKDHENR